ncbi:MAG: YaiI/YqxD family protein [Mariniblastus sp.]|nr:YaiI/YqxD family protein [Mariniblastus sp.]
MDPSPPAPFQIWVDADACPLEIKTLLFRSAQKRHVTTILVANQSLRIPDSPYLHMRTVRHGLDVADQTIADSMQPGDLVITADIPLAAQVVAQGGLAIGPRGELFDENQIQARLASRNLMDHLRSSGLETSGPRPISGKDVQAFANQLDRILTKRLAKHS